MPNFSNKQPRFFAKKIMPKSDSKRTGTGPAFLLFAPIFFELCDFHKVIPRFST
jgi:hypothetical protein